ncbi:molybdate ABC transporter permease subunit [Ferrovum sp.]|uniref:molybdate ABC transporter permease subunit n=1 Tax=Ferrovum sp. TaxID=2609467 RepID=UPI0026249119|nr:molybdate ABC transporter permease subunit [Ferrovum sp.]
MDSFLSALKISLWVATSSTLLVALFGLALAFVLARCHFRGKNFVDAVVTIPMVLPPTVVGYCLMMLLGREGVIGAPLYRLTGWSFVFTWQGAAIAAFIVSLPLMVRVARSAIESVDEDLIRISYSLGKSEWETFVHVILPLARGGIMAGMVLAFARGLGEFGATLMIAGNIPGKTSTLSLSIYSAFQAGDDAKAEQLAWVLTGISVFVIYLSGKLSRGRWM